MDSVVTNLQNLGIAVFGLGVVAIGVWLIFRARKAQYADTARVGFVAVVAMVFLAVGVGAISYVSFGTGLLNGVGGGAVAPAPRRT